MFVCKSPVRAALLRMFHHNLTAPLLPDIKIAKRRSNDVNQARTPNTAERNICCPTSVIGAAGRPLYIAQPKDHEIHGTASMNLLQKIYKYFIIICLSCEC